MRKYRLPLLLFCIFGYLQYALWFGRNNVIDYQYTRQVVKNMQIENNELKQRNEKMFAETADLYDGLEAIEERARTELGMIKPGEHFYRIISNNERE